MSRCRFDTFVFDPGDGRLEHVERHTAITLRPQVASLLSRLLENPRTVVEREALCRAIWGEKAVVDFESGLAAVVHELRQAFAGLGGAAELLETVPRRGYRLRADVAPLGATGGQFEDEAKPPSARRPAKSWAGILSASLVVLLVLASVAWWLQRPPAVVVVEAQPDRLALAVLPFERYGDSVADGTRLELLLADSLLAELWRAELERIVLIGRATLRPYQDRTDVAATVAADLGARLLVEGSIVRLETGWRVTARLLEMPGGRILWLDVVESGAEVLPTGDIAAHLAVSLARAWATQPETQAQRGLSE